MQLPPMNAPAVLRRRTRSAIGEDVVVARGPFIILASGVMAMAPEARAELHLAVDGTELSGEAIVEAVRLWRGERVDG